MLALPGIKETRNNVGGFVPNSGFESINVSRCSLATRERTPVQLWGSRSIWDFYAQATATKPGWRESLGVQHSGRH